MDYSVKIGSVVLKNPVVTGSGTFGFGQEYNEYYDISQLGAIGAKGLTLQERQGNPPHRIAETPSGILNSVGLQNPGVHAFLEQDLPVLKKQNATVIANISGNTIEEYCEMASILSTSDVDIIEMNISCPNVKQGGVAFGTDDAVIYEITSRVKEHCRQPLVVKLSPNVTDIAKMAVAAQRGGADGISLINTLLGMAIDIKTKRPVLANNVGGLSGPAVKPIALRMVWQVANAVSIPIIGMGGIMTWEDAIEFILAGATAVSVGTACFLDPMAPIKVLNGIQQYLIDQNLECFEDIRGKLILN